MRRLAMVAVLVAGCGGTDEGLVPTLSSIQEHVFTPRCATAKCHATAVKPHMLSLADGETWGMLSGPSVIVPTSARLVPSSPIAGLVARVLSANEWYAGELKIRRMPPDGRLDNGEVAAILQWIEAGALDN